LADVVRMCDYKSQGSINKPCFDYKSLFGSKDC